MVPPLLVATGCRPIRAPAFTTSAVDVVLLEPAAVHGCPTPVLRNCGQWLARNDGRAVLVTVHPSALLRLPDDDFAQGLDAFVRDLGQAAERAG